MILDVKLIALAVGALYMHGKAKAAPAVQPSTNPPSGARVTIPKNERRVPLIVQGIDGASFGASGGGEGGA
jgi:hypothetical protein